MKYVQDYIGILKEEFPYLTEKDILRILTYGFRKMYQHNIAGCDTLIKSNNNCMWFYIGELQNNPIKHYRYYNKKMRRKLRFLHRSRQIVWDGYYYTGLTNEEYQQYLKDINKKGRRKRNFVFENKIHFKILDEAKLYYHSAKAIIRFPYFTERTYSVKKDKFTYKDPEILLVRETNLKFKDILLESNNYEFL